MVFWHVTHDICRRRDACPWSGHTRGGHFLPHVLGIKRGRMIFVRGVSFLAWQNGLFVAYFDVDTGGFAGIRKCVQSSRGLIKKNCLCDGFYRCFVKLDSPIFNTFACIKKLLEKSCVVVARCNCIAWWDVVLLTLRNVCSLINAQ